MENIGAAGSAEYSSSVSRRRGWSVLNFFSVRPARRALVGVCKFENSWMPGIAE